MRYTFSRISYRANSCLSIGGIVPLLALDIPNSRTLFAAAELHFASIVIETHDDTTQRLLDPYFDIAVCHSHGSIDIPACAKAVLPESSLRYGFPAPQIRLLPIANATNPEFDT